MNLNEYLTKNNRTTKDIVILFSVGTALDTVDGNTFPLNDDSTIAFDDYPFNLFDLTDGRNEWVERLDVVDKKVVDDWIDENLEEQMFFDVNGKPFFGTPEDNESGGYIEEGISKEEVELYNSVPPCSSMTPVGDK